LIEQEEEAIYQRVKTRRTVEIAKSYVKMNCESNIIAKLEEGDYLTLANRYLSKMGDDCTPEYVWKEVIEEFIKEKKFFVGLLGDETGLYAMSNLVDVSELAFFDDLEYQCWELFEKYAEKFGVHIVQTDENDIDFYTAKQIQDAILKQFEDAGIKFIYEKKDE